MSAPEEWREVPGCPGYEVSSVGRVRHDGRLFRLSMRVGHQSSYPQVPLRRADGTLWQPTLHSVMLRAFVGPRPSPMHVGAHLDGNPANNTLGNLAWVTYRENAAHRRQHGTAGRVLDEQRAALIRARVAAGEPQICVARDLGVCRTLVNHVVHGRAWATTTPT